MADVETKLPVPLIAQQTRMWCWAASGQMVMSYIGGKSVPQCSQASHYFNNPACCATPFQCVNGGWPELGYYGFTFKRTTDLALDWDALKAQIDSGKPFCFSWHWNDGGGHMMVVIGYATQGTTRLVWIHDPWEVDKGATYSITYDAFIKGNNHTHWDDFFDIEFPKA